MHDMKKFYRHFCFIVLFIYSLYLQTYCLNIVFSTLSFCNFVTFLSKLSYRVVPSFCNVNIFEKVIIFLKHRLFAFQRSLLPNCTCKNRSQQNESTRSWTKSTCSIWSIIGQSNSSSQQKNGATEKEIRVAHFSMLR